MAIRLLMPIVFLVIGGYFLTGTFQLPKARLGDPNGPLYFPAIISILLIVLSLINFVQEWKKRNKEVEEVKQLLKGRARFLMVTTLALIIIYSFLFERLGFLFSSMIFLGGLLFVVNGLNKWLQNIIITVLFSFVSWYVFAELLKVSLP